MQPIMGICSKCNETIYADTLFMVTKWKSVSRGSALQIMKVQVPAVIECRECAPPPKPRVKPVAVAAPGAAPVAKVPVTSGDLPFRPSSMMRYVIEKAIKGVKLAVLKAEVMAKGANWSLQEKVLMSGGGCNYCKTHTWVIQSDAEGVVRVSNIRPVAVGA